MHEHTYLCLLVSLNKTRTLVGWSITQIVFDSAQQLVIKLIQLHWNNWGGQLGKGGGGRRVLRVSRVLVQCSNSTICYPSSSLNQKHGSYSIGQPTRLHHLHMRVSHGKNYMLGLCVYGSVCIWGKLSILKKIFSQKTVIRNCHNLLFFFLFF